MKKSLGRAAAVAVFGACIGAAAAQSAPPTPQFSQTFDSTGHPKALGARVVVKYPAGWKAEESARQKTIQTFTGEFAGVPMALVLAIEPQDQAECGRATREDWIRGIPPGWKSVDARALTWQRLPGAVFKGVQVREVNGFEVRSAMRALLVCQGGRLIKAVCTGSVAASAGRLPDLALCDRFFETLTITSR